MKDGGMRQRFHRRYQDKRRAVEIGNVDLVTMGFEISARKRASVPHDGVDIFELFDTWNLLIQDTMQCRIDAVRRDGRIDQLARRKLYRARGDLEVCIADHAR